MFVLPIVSTTSYLLICYLLKRSQSYFKELYKHSWYKNLIKYISIVHNFGLIIFSAYTFIALIVESHSIFKTYNIIEWNSAKISEHTQFLCYLFTYSKIWEFLDTFLILLKGNDTIFLQKYHHTGAVVVWYLSTYYRSPAIIIATVLNGFIHTLMYTYYLLCLLGYRFNAVKPFITSSQLTQLIGGNIIVYIYYLPYSSTFDIYWSTQVFLWYVNILVVLFLDFSYKNYIRKTK